MIVIQIVIHLHIHKAPEVLRPEQPMTTAQIIAANNFSKSTFAGSLSGFIQYTKNEDAKAVGLTKKAFGELAYQIYQKRQLRTKQKSIVLVSDRTVKEDGSISFRSRPQTIGEAMLNRINKQLTKKLIDGFTYRMPESRWVEQANEIRAMIRPGKASDFEVSQRVVWHPKHNWRANETTHTLYLNPLDTFTTVGGLLTVYRKSDAHLKEIPCRWWEQSKGFEVREVQGWLIDGLYHTEDKEKKSAAKKNLALLKNGKIDEVEFTASLVHKAYGFCMAGIRQFCEANGLDPKGKYTGMELRRAVIAHRELNCRMYQHYLAKMGLTLNCK